MKQLFIILLLITANSFAQNTAFWLPSVLSDNMVLQQNSDARIWGKAAPNARITVKPSWTKPLEAIADQSGKWLISIKTKKAGGPYSISLSCGTEERVIKNILFGEVWLCSGQSNMEMPLAGWPPTDTIQGSRDEIRAADFPDIRVFTVVRNYTGLPQDDCNGSWAVCTPQNAPGFTATGYFFAKRLYQGLRVPVGLIHSSWGGTPAEAWAHPDYLTKYPDFVKQINNYPAAEKEIQILSTWLAKMKHLDLQSLPAEEQWKNLVFDDLECKNVEYNDSLWGTISLPGLWEQRGLNEFNGVVWFRKHVMLPDAFKNKQLALHLSKIDDMDVAFVNGVQVGATEIEGKWQDDRIYTVPAELTSKGELVIAVRVLDNQGGGGIWGAAENLKIVEAANPTSFISVAGDWKYLPVAEYKNFGFFYWGSKAEVYQTRPVVNSPISAFTPATLYNGMINPLIPFVFKGAIWYQGESNSGNPLQYRTLFPDMITSWRKTMQNGDFPFYFVQIAPYNYGAGTKSQLLREAQLLTSLRAKNTGMAVTLDIGNPANIHPANKKDVGERLAAIALAKTYDKNCPFSGPVYKTMKKDNGRIIISFYLGEGLQVEPRNGKSNFLIAGEDRVFYNAEVTVQKNKLIVSSPKVAAPVAVRYCWDNTSEATLFNGDQLPASSFRTDDWQE